MIAHLQTTADLSSTGLNTLDAGVAILDVLRYGHGRVVGLARIAIPTIAMTLTNGTARTGGADAGGSRFAYAGRTTTFVLTGVRE